MASVIKLIDTVKNPILGCFPLYPPLELFHSMGFTPIVLWGLKNSVKKTSESNKHIQDFACSVARNLVEFLFSSVNNFISGFFTYNACDTLRNLPEIILNGLSIEKKSY